MKRLLIVLGVGILLGGCGQLQKPPSFVTQATLDEAVDTVAETLSADGYMAKKIGHQSNVVQTTWKRTDALVEKVKGQPAIAFRRFTVTLSPMEKGVEVKTRMDCKRCQLGSSETTRGHIRGVCEDLVVMPSGFQEDLEALSKKLEQALKEQKRGEQEESEEEQADDVPATQ